MAGQSVLNLSDCTATKLRHLARVVSRHYDVELANAGLTTAQFWLLSAVEVCGPIQPSDLAEAMSLDPSTLTRSLKPLLANSWVRLGPGCNGRTRSISITSLGRNTRAEGLHYWTAAQANTHGLLGSRNVNQLHALMDVCLSLMQGASDPAPRNH